MSKPIVKSRLVDPPKVKSPKIRKKAVGKKDSASVEPAERMDRLG